MDEKQSCGAVLFSAAPAPTLRIFTAPAPGQFQKAINQKIKVIISFFENEKKNKWYPCVDRTFTEKKPKFWKNMLVMKVFLLDNFWSRSLSLSRSRKHNFFLAPALVKNYSSATLFIWINSCLISWQEGWAHMYITFY